MNYTKPLGYSFRYNSLGNLTITCDKSESWYSSLSQASRDINFLQMDHISSVECFIDLVAAHFHNIDIFLLKSEDCGRVNDSSIIDLTGFKKTKAL